MANTNEIVKLHGINFCKYCNRLTLRLHYDFIFYEIGTDYKLTRDCKICDTCNALHYLNYGGDKKVTVSMNYLVKNAFPDLDNKKLGAWIKIDAVEHLREFYKTHNSPPLQRMLSSGLFDKPKINFEKSSLIVLPNSNLKDKWSPKIPVSGVSKKKPTNLIHLPESTHIMTIIGNIAKIEL